MAKQELPATIRVSGAEKLGHWGGVIQLATCPTHGIRMEAAFFTQPLSAHLLDAPMADLQELGRFPLAHSIRTLQPDVLPLLFSRARPSDKEMASVRAFAWLGTGHSLSD